MIYNAAAMPIVSLVVAAVLIVIAGLMFLLDMVGRAELIQGRWPRVWKWVTSRPLILLMLLVSLALLDRDFKDAMVTALPAIVNVAPPPAPQQIPEPRIVTPALPKPEKTVG